MGGTSAAWPRSIATEFSRLKRAFQQRQRKPAARVAWRLALLLANGTEDAVPAMAPAPTRPQKLLTVKQVALELQVSTKTVYQHAEEWPFMHRVPGSNRIRGDLDELHAYIRTQPSGRRR